MRLFVAIDVPDEIKTSIETDVVDVLRKHISDAKWTRPDGRHLTLKFLGNVDEAHVGELVEVLGPAAARHRPFTAAFSDVGGFPDLKRPRVLWVGVGEGAEAMAELARDVEHELEPLGFASEGRPFRGHFTLARFPRPMPIRKLPEVVVPMHTFDVAEVVLFESKLHPKGARYTAVERFSLSS